MDERRQHHDLLPFSEAGKRLLKNEDYQLLVSDFEKELADLWRLLRETPTTDPVIAKIQGELNRLESVLGRAQAWINLTAEAAKAIKPRQEPVDDYLTG